AQGDLEGWIHLWHRPALRFTDTKALRGLTQWVKDLGIEMLWVDPWMSVSGIGTNSNQSDDVRPQLDAYAAIRDDVAGLTIGLVAHAGKGGPDKGTRITDAILGSVAFGGWFDGALLFNR